jgi:hypothetical protein
VFGFTAGIYARSGSGWLPLATLPSVHVVGTFSPLTRRPERRVMFIADGGARGRSAS